jgi:hypothetical protein
MKIYYTKKFVQWCCSLDEKSMAKVEAYIQTFANNQEKISEPHGSPEFRSRYQPNLFTLYPTNQDKSYLVFCFCNHGNIYVINGYDANAILDRKLMVNEVDQAIDYLVSIASESKPKKRSKQKAVSESLAGQLMLVP